MTEPRVAITLLHAFCRDEALAGDILEEFQLRHSRLWLWRQVAVVVLLGLPYGIVRYRPARRPMPVPIGGFGVLGLAVLITFVAPGAWWFVAVAAAGGAVLGGVMIVAGRRRALTRGGRRNILLPLILAAAAVDAAAQPQPRPAVRIDPIDGTSRPSRPTMWSCCREGTAAGCSTICCWRSREIRNFRGRSPTSSSSSAVRDTRTSSIAHAPRPDCCCGPA
jgi:hypothetical protein